MRHSQALQIIVFSCLLFSCKKEHNPTPPPPPGLVKKILLKDITMPHLPSPYYHFEYSSDSMANRVEFDSGLTMYSILYNGNKIGEMRNNIIVNHDTLRYFYDDAGKVTAIKFINEANVVYRRVSFAYNGNVVKEIDWAQKEGNSGFKTDRTLTFTYQPDANVKTIVERRLNTTTGTLQLSYTRQFEQYDDKINVDDFSLIHDGIHDHLFLLQGFRLQKNNPIKEIYSGGDVPFGYSIDYTYTYKNDNTPVLKTGDLLFTAGSDAGKRFQTSTVYSYY